MGQENSSLIDDDTPTETLSDRSIEAVARYIKDGKAKRIVCMTGAGISTAAGIPDFRSPGTGLYNNLARLNLPHPEAVFEIDFFRENPAPFYVLARELYPGNFSPTIAHAFIALLAKRKLLQMLFTQNIDCLERSAGVPGDIIVEAHGSFASQRCIDCKTAFPDKEMREHVELGDPPSCMQPGCGGLVKPDIVFFGEQLPSTFFDNRHVPAMADLVLVLGTSLMVQPFASLPGLAREGVPRVLFNMQRVGDLGTRPDDVLCIDTCDAGVRKLAEHLGWIKELEEMWVGIVGEKEAERQRNSKATWVPPPESDSEDDEIQKLVDELEGRLDVTDNEPDNKTAAAHADDGGVVKQDDGTEAKQPTTTTTTTTTTTASATQEAQASTGAAGETAAKAASADVPQDNAAGSASHDTRADKDAAAQRLPAAEEEGAVVPGHADQGGSGKEEGSQAKKEEATEGEIKTGSVATYTPIQPEDGNGDGGRDSSKSTL